MKLAESKPIFIVGSGRSGTSVLTWCLGQHPNILPLPETHWIARLTVHMQQWYQFGTVHGRYSHLGALDWTEDDFYAEFGRYVNQFIVNTRESRLRFIRKLSAKNQGLSDAQLAALEQKGELSPDPVLVSAKNYQVVRSANDPKERWVDGGPENTYYMYSLSRLFTGAKFIHLLRDPNDVAKSFMKFSEAGSAGSDRSEAEGFSQWHRFVEYAIKGERALGREKVLRIHYDDLIQRPEETLKQCFHFLGEKFTPDTLLPLDEKINSSKATAGTITLSGKTAEGRKANEFYRSILGTAPGEADSQALGELIDHFTNYAKHVNAN